jgi:ABC-type bacteriocin/lantibiotic exporter with double-glycine peptidase domain
LASFDLRDLRSQLGIVLQGSFLFSDTIRRNIALNDPEMSLDRVRWAAETAAVASDIEAMPMGYETVLSEMANNLSGGQRQRLCLARALAHQPRILLLDEATSELDTRTEGVIQGNLSRLQCTRIVVAHRLSTIRNANCILVLNGGQIVERGSHQTLADRGGLYAQLIEAQVAATTSMH